MEVPLRIPYTLLVRSYSTAFTKADSLPDYGQMTVKDEGEQAVIPGTSLAGAFRSHIARIVKQEWFTGKDRKPIGLEMRAEPYTIERTVEWLKRQAAPSLVTIHRIEEQNGTHLLEDILKQAKLKEAHRIRIRQMTTAVKDMIDTAVPANENDGIF